MVSSAREPITLSNKKLRNRNSAVQNYSLTSPREAAVAAALRAARLCGRTNDEIEERDELEARVPRPDWA